VLCLVRRKIGELVVPRAARRILARANQPAPRPFVERVHRHAKPHRRLARR